MPFEKTYKVRKASSKRKAKEIGLPPEWCKYHDIEIGDSLTMLGDSILVIFPNNDKETEAKVRAFLEGGKIPSSTNTTE
jgi:hypothetical protein